MNLSRLLCLWTLLSFFIVSSSVFAYQLSGEEWAAGEAAFQLQDYRTAIRYLQAALALDKDLEWARELLEISGLTLLLPPRKMESDYCQSLLYASLRCQYVPKIASLKPTSETSEPS